MSDLEIIRRFLWPNDPLLARRITSLLRAYERGRLRHAALHDDLVRSHGDRQEPPVLRHFGADNLDV